MRVIGKFESEKDARAFIAILSRQGIDSRVETHEQGYFIWILEEDQIDRAEELFKQYLDNPDHNELHKVSEETLLNSPRLVRLRMNKPSPLTVGIIALCVFIFLMNIMQKGQPPFGLTPLSQKLIFEYP